MKKKIVIILIPLILFSSISGCFRVPLSNEFKISEIALYRTAVIDAPKDVKITHLWSKPDGEDKIIITFNKDVDLVSSLDKKEKLRSLEVGRTNVEILKEENSWIKVAVYYPKYSSNDKEIQSMHPFADFDVLLDSNFVERVEGYIPSDSYSIIPRPLNPDNFVSAGSTDDVGSDKPVLVNVVVVEGFAHQHEYIDLGTKLTKEQTDFLEMETFAFISWAWQEGPALIPTTVSGKPVPLLMVWEHNWDDNDYNIFNRVRTEYVENILNYIDN